MPNDDIPVVDEEFHKEEAVPIELKYRRSPEFKMYYCNNVQISPGDSDVQFFFGQILAPMVGEKPKEIISTQLFGVVVTVEHAKRILALLDRQIKVAEKIRTAAQQSQQVPQEEDSH